MEAKQAVGALGALAHEHRLGIYRMLIEQGPAGLAAGVIAERLGIPSSSLTFHLQQLLHADLVTQRRASRQLIYAADFGTMNGLVAYLTDKCCGREAQTAPACEPGLVPESARATIAAPTRSKSA